MGRGGGASFSVVEEEGRGGGGAGKEEEEEEEEAGEGVGERVSRLRRAFSLAMSTLCRRGEEGGRGREDEAAFPSPPPPSS